MKTVLCFVLLLVVLSNFTSGQSSPTNFNPNILVHSQGLPNELLLFVPDTATQILFNPARANDYIGSFVYSTYAADFKRIVYLSPYYNEQLPYSSYPSTNYTESYAQGKNPTIAVATLFNALNSKWLFLFTNGIARQNGTSNNKSAINNADNYYQTNLSLSSSSNDSEIKEGITSFRLSTIFSSKAGNGSAGVFAIFNSTLNNSLGNSTNNSVRITNEIPLYYNSSVNSRNNKSDRDNSQYVLGFEYTLANELWDNVLRVSYQKSIYNFRNKLYSNTQTYDSAYYGSSNTPISTTNKSNRTNRIENYNQSEPYAFAFENYYQHKTTILTLDANVFVSANAYYSIGDGKVGGNYFSGSAYYDNGILSSKDTTSNSHEKKSDDKNLGITFTPGFILKKNFADLFLLAGAKIETGYKKYNNTQSDYNYSSYPNFISTATKLTFITLTFPVYINYSPAEWISIWGGMNYSYGYIRGVIEGSESSINYKNVSYPQTYTVNSNHENSTYQSSKSTFLGLELKHPSGLRVQISFDEEVASFRDWNMSVGYHF